jgi:hypothetical protein
MNGRFVYLKKSLAIAGFLLLSSVVDAQVMWNLKGGWMGRKAIVQESEVEEKNRPDWMAGLELEIPLSDKLNLETGLRYRDHKIWVVKEYDYDIGGEKFTRNFDANANFEIPLRLAYKQQLGKHFSLHAGVGPYISTCYGAGWDRFNAEYHGSNWSDIEWSDAKFKDMTNVGLESSIAINWACLSLGATYNTPCFYKGYKDENKPIIMATLGIRFKSSAWRYVGATLLTIATVGGAAASAWSSAVEANQNYSSSSYGSYGSSSSRNSSSSTTGNKYSITGQQNANNAQTAYNRYGDLLSKHFYGSTSATLSEVKQWQNEMKKLKQKWGDKIVYNDLQDKSTSNCINSSHSH